MNEKVHFSDDDSGILGETPSAPLQESNLYDLPIITSSDSPPNWAKGNWWEQVQVTLVARYNWD